MGRTEGSSLAPWQMLGVAEEIQDTIIGHSVSFIYTGQSRCRLPCEKSFHLWHYFWIKSLRKEWFLLSRPGWGWQVYLFVYLLGSFHCFVYFSISLYIVYIQYSLSRKKSLGSYRIMHPTQSAKQTPHLDRHLSKPHKAHGPNSSHNHLESPTMIHGDQRTQYLRHTMKITLHLKKRSRSKTM